MGITTAYAESVIFLIFAAGSAVRLLTAKTVYTIGVFTTNACIVKTWYGQPQGWPSIEVFAQTPFCTNLKRQRQ